MAALIVGNSLTFAIESGITQAYENLSQRALGYFVIHVGGKKYGVHAPEATLLACSLDAVHRRIVQRGAHSMSIGADADALTLAEAVLTVAYDEVSPSAAFFGMSADEFRRALIASEIVWAPDGDAAFDDGGHVLQFDVCDQVRLIAFMNPVHRQDVASSLTDVWIGAEEFYGMLDEWQRRFQIEWTASSMATPALSP
jgi:hypothetical protein